MKKFGLFLFAALTAAAFSSCNESDGDYPSYGYFVTVQPLDNSDYYFRLDDEKTIYSGDKSRIGTYEAKEGQRAVIYFNQLPKAEGYDYNAKLYAIEDIYTGKGQIIPEGEQETLDDLGDDKISFYHAWLSKNYLTLLVSYPVHDNSKHTFALIRNDIDEPDYKYEGYVNLELRHNADGETQGFDPQCYISFDLAELKPDLEGKKGITLRVKTQLNGIKYIQIELPQEK